MTGCEMKNTVCAVHLVTGKREPCSQLFRHWKSAVLATEKPYWTSCRGALSQRDGSYMIIRVSSWENLQSSFENKFLNTAVSPKNLVWGPTFLSSKTFPPWPEHLQNWLFYTFHFLFSVKTGKVKSNRGRCVSDTVDTTRHIMATRLLIWDVIRCLWVWVRVKSCKLGRAFILKLIMDHN